MLEKHHYGPRDWKHRFLQRGTNWHCLVPMRHSSGEIVNYRSSHRTKMKISRLEELIAFQLLFCTPSPLHLVGFCVQKGNWIWCPGLVNKVVMGRVQACAIQFIVLFHPVLGRHVVCSVLERTIVCFLYFCTFSLN